MTKKQLNRIRQLKKEKAYLEAKLKEPPSYKDFVLDIAKDYSTGYPHSIRIEGYGSNNYPELQQKYYDKLLLIREELLMLENWLDSVSDPLLRNILRLQYVEGFTQARIADELGYSKRSVERILQKFWENEKMSVNGGL